MELVRALYERMKLVTRLYKALAALAVVAAIVVTARLIVANKRIASNRVQAADAFYQMKALELEVARLQADAPQREDYIRRRTALQATYDDWNARLEDAAHATADERAIRNAVGRLGEARVLVSAIFLEDVRKKVAEWRRTPDYDRLVRAAREGGFIRRIDSVLTAENMPSDLLWVAFQESRFRTNAVGPATRFGIAKGMWQLLPMTARQYGLRIGPLSGEERFDPADQRHDFHRSTMAAVKYMTDLYLLDTQGSGLLVMACYNAGQTRLLRLLRSLPATPRDRNFWRLLETHRDEIPDETYGYVVGIVAASAVAAEPAAFGRVIN